MSATSRAPWIRISIRGQADELGADSPLFIATRPLAEGEEIELELTAAGFRLVDPDDAPAAALPLMAAQLSDTTGAT